MLKTLLRLNMKAYFFSMFSMGGKKAGAGKKILLGIIFAYAICAFMFSFGALFYSIITPFYEEGVGWLYFALFAAIVFVLCVVTTIFVAGSQLFEAKDNERLLALPIKPATILISRLAVLLIIEYAFSLFFSIPAVAIWIYHGYATAIGGVYFAIAFLLLPLIALSVSLILAWLLSLATARMRNKNVFTLVLSLAFLIGYFGFASKLQNYLGMLMEKGEELAAAFQKAMPPFYYMGTAIAGGSLGSLAIFALWCIAPFALCIWLLSINYIKLLTRKPGTRGKAYVAKEHAVSTPLWALTKKELRYFWSKPMVILNTSIGSVFMIIAAIYLIYQKDALFGQIYPIMNYLGGGITFPLLLAVALAFLATTNNLSASLISLEGKYLWLAKSLPVSAKTILDSKLLTHMLTTAIPVFIASSLLATLATSISEIALIFILPLSFTLFMGIFGLALNLTYPKLEWLNEIIVVKQGLSAMIAIFGGMGLAAGLALLYIYVLAIPLMVFLYIITAAFVVASVLCYGWLVRQGAAKFESL